MYEVVIIVEERSGKERKKVDAVLQGEERKELMDRVADTICSLIKDNNFKNPLAEYALSKNGTYIDGEVDLKVKVSKLGVNVKLGELVV